MRLEYEHGLTNAQAYERLENFRDVLFEMYGSLLKDFNYRWNADRSYLDFYAKALGIKVKGTLRLEDRCVVIESKLPFLVRRIISDASLEGLAREQLDRIFHKDGADYNLVLDK